MSDSSTGSSSIKPLLTVGANDLHQIGGVAKSGFLRKEGKLEREFAKLGKVVSSFKWRQKYIVLSKGCLYVYDNEDSSSPKSAFSLYGYNRVARVEGAVSTMRYAFQIVLSGPSERRRTFAATTEEERKDWMCSIYEIMAKLNSVDCPRKCEILENAATFLKMSTKLRRLIITTVLHMFSYEQLEKPLFDYSSKHVKAIEHANKDSDSDSDDYEKILEEKAQRQRYHPDPTSKREPPKRELPAIPVPATDSAQRKAIELAKKEEEMLKHKKLPEPAKETSRRKSEPASKFHRKSKPLPGEPGNSEEHQTTSSPEPDSSKSLKHQKPGYLNMETQKPAYINKPVVKPPVAPKPKPKLKQDDTYEEYSECYGSETKDVALTPADYEFEEYDSASAKQFLSGKAVGTFLTRLPNQDSYKVLMAVAKDQNVKQFRIHIKENKFTIDHKTVFPSVKELLEHYRKFDLPNQDFKLSNGYKT